MQLSARGARIALFCILIPIQIPLVVSMELGVCSDGVRRFARAYTALALRIVAHFCTSEEHKRAHKSRTLLCRF